MDKKFIAIGLAVVVLIGGYKTYQKAGQEYARFSSVVLSSLCKLSEGIDEATRTARSARETSDSIRETVEGLRERLARLESSSVATVAAKQSEIDSLVDLLEKEQARRMQAELDAEQASQSAKVMSKPQVVTAGPKIVMHSGAGCEPCERWKREQMPAWKAKGWTVEVIQETQSDRWWPWFEVYEGGKRFEVDGPLTLDSYNKAKR
jgi:uncharacterized protein YfaS (alpha-2-macroglobulin family)